jgi:hypothetical protein
MSLTSSIRIPIQWSNVDVFTFGKTSLYGYDSLNHCLIVQSLIELNNISNDRFHLSSSPAWSIRRLILNEDETILALLADKIAYLVYLPQSNNSPAQGFYLKQKKKLICINNFRISSLSNYPSISIHHIFHFNQLFIN